MLGDVTIFCFLFQYLHKSEGIKLYSSRVSVYSVVFLFSFFVEMLLLVYHSKNRDKKIGYQED